jgi:hypothetical protein
MFVDEDELRTELGEGLAASIENIIPIDRAINE